MSVSKQIGALVADRADERERRNGDIGGEFRRFRIGFTRFGRLRWVGQLVRIELGILGLVGLADASRAAADFQLYRPRMGDLESIGQFDCGRRVGDVWRHR
jgi:hypothetical protein